MTDHHPTLLTFIGLAGAGYMNSCEGLPQLRLKIAPVVINTATESAPFLHNVTISFVPLMMEHFRRYKTLQLACKASPPMGSVGDIVSLAIWKLLE